MTDKVWTTSQALAWTASRFAADGIETARLDAELLLARALGSERVELYSNPDRPLTAEERAVYRGFIERRLAGEPVAYLVGTKSFRYLTLKVNGSVLVPRPESEQLVEAAVLFAGGSGVTAADVGTGSGAIATSIAKEMNGSTVYATDVCEEALAVARANAGVAGVADRVKFLAGDLLDPLPAELAGTLDIVVSNPPYIPTGEIEKLPRDIRDYEPRRALDGGEDGLGVLRRLVPAACRFLRKGGMLALEIGETQATEVTGMMEPDFEDVRVEKDLAGLDRLARGIRRR